MRKSTSGFTIVELLIVIVVIAILATISIVAYTGIQNRAHTSIVQSDLATNAKKLEVYKILNGEYPDTSAEFIAAELSFTRSSYQYMIYCVQNTDDSNWALVARTSTGDNYYQMAKQGWQSFSGSWYSSTTVCDATGMTSADVRVYLLGLSGWNSTWLPS